MLHVESQCMLKNFAMGVCNPFIMSRRFILIFISIVYVEPQKSILNCVRLSKCWLLNFLLFDRAQRSSSNRIRSSKSTGGNVLFLTASVQIILTILQEHGRLILNQQQEIPELITVYDDVHCSCRIIGTRSGATLKLMRTILCSREIIGCTIEYSPSNVVPN